MTKKLLTEKLAFIADESINKTILLYVTTGTTGLQLFNIEEADLPGLLNEFVESIEKLILKKDDITIEDYSTSQKRGGVLHHYDLGGDKPMEMQRMIDVTTILDPAYFDKGKTGIDKINGLYIVIKSNDNANCLSLYKMMSNLDTTYASSTYLIIGSSNTQFKRQKENMLKVSPSFQMLQLDGEIIILDLDKLEKPLELNEILKKETENAVKAVGGKIVVDTKHLKNVCEKPSVCKKLRHAMKESQLVSLLNDGKLTGEALINAVETHTNLKFNYNEDKTKFQLKTDAEAERFVKLMDDDYLYSYFSKVYYESWEKKALTK